MLARHDFSSQFDIKAKDAFMSVLAGSPSRGGDVTVYVLDINQRCLPTLFILFVSVSVFITLSTVFHSINSPNNFQLYHSILPV